MIDDRDKAYDDRLLAMIRGACEGLSEHFEAIQIVATRSDGKNTRITSWGSGNMFAREGMVAAWLKQSTNTSLEDSEE